ncbi:uncharacterized protein LOC132177155 [Corylus avellana]|uniref:uncharacterized protein LOC132177155 n=1 Tax=Corylus avellana TaxID=13451 RepID=UPI00286AADC8|nr:uncharacterized protein LOC132177155 [Corylus avellana]
MQLCKSSILTVPLSNTDQPDRQIWRGTVNGEFSVRSAYHLWKENICQSSAEGSKKNEDSKIWRKVWKLGIPNAWKLCFWRACHDLLPTRANLVSRRVTEDPRCPICGLEEETTLHILWSCESAKDVWSTMGRQFQKSWCRGPTFLAVVEGLLGKCDDEDLQLLVGVTRNIWRRRNEWIHEGKFISPNDIVEVTNRGVEEYMKANMHNHSQRGDDESPTRWKAPENGWVKVNWDIALDKANGRIGVGVIVRNEAGRVIAAKGSTRLGLLDATAAEALGAFMAVCLCKDLRLTQIYLEGDAKTVVDAVTAGERSSRNFGQLIDDIREMLALFPNWRIGHIRRGGNNAAHVLAKEAMKRVIDKLWIDEIPMCISDIIVEEQIALSN